MNFAILAAGEGSRLAQEGAELPKPLVRIQGEAMVDRLIRIFHSCGAESIHIITNDLTPLTQTHLRKLQEQDPKLHLIVKTTPSSMHSFYELRQVLGRGSSASLRWTPSFGRRNSGSTSEPGKHRTMTASWR